MTGLSIADVVREASRCRTALLSRLQRPVNAFAYPFGDADGVVQHLVGACGYEFGVTCEPRRSRPDDPPMALPRIEVRGGDTLADFIAKLAEGWKASRDAVSSCHPSDATAHQANVPRHAAACGAGDSPGLRRRAVRSAT